MLTVASGHLLNCVLDKLAVKCSTNTHLRSEKDLKHTKWLARTRWRTALQRCQIYILKIYRWITEDVLKVYVYVYTYIFI